MEAPPKVTALAEARGAARTDRDFAAADALRDQIADLGWLVRDSADGFILEPLPPFTQYARIEDAARDVALPHAPVTIAVLIDGWPEDARTCASALIDYAPADAVIVCLDIGNIDGAGEAVAGLGDGKRLVDVHVAGAVGWSTAVTALLKMSNSRVVALLDMSTVVEGPGALEPLIGAVGASGVVAAAWRGVDVDLVDEWRSMVPAGPGEVDAFLGYCVALDREAALATPPHPKARFYRNADMEWSLRMRAAGGRIVVPTGDLPIRQGRHHGYHDSDREMRDRESRRTYNRLLAEFRGRNEILRPRP
jgi:hypothetical protein